MESWKGELVRYVLEHGDSLEFTKYFWKGCEPIETDIVQYWKFVSTIRLLREGMTIKEVAEEVLASEGSVSNWRTFTKLPKLAHYLKFYLQMGIPPEDQRWLTMECSHGYGIPIGNFIKVPTSANSWCDVDSVLAQCQSLRSEPSIHSREYHFGFLIGIMMGDAAKSKSNEGSAHRHIGLVLSQKYETNLSIGEFAALSAQVLGLRMHRTEDLKPEGKPHAFYEWTSQASPFVDWMFNVALGLKDGELTTYDSVRADWMLSSPREFRLGLIQGLAESDGSVNISGQIVEFWVDPHRELLRRILEMEGLRAFNSRQALSLSKTQAVRSFAVPIFSPHLKTIRYRKHEIMATARRLARKDRLAPDLRNEIIRLSLSGSSVPEIIEKIALQQKVLISFEAAQRWAAKARLMKDTASVSSDCTNNA